MFASFFNFLLLAFVVVNCAISSGLCTTTTSPLCTYVAVPCMSDTDAPSRCCYGVGSQSSNLFALYLGAVPDSAKQATVASLLASFNSNNSSSSSSSSFSTTTGGGDGGTNSGPHLDVGIFGTTYVFDVLSTLGETDLAMAVLEQTTAPSLGYMIANTATTLWEAWDGDAHTIGHTGTSRNHIMFGGGVNRFLMRAVGGLWVDESPSLSSSQFQGQGNIVKHKDSGAEANLLLLPGWHKVQVGPSATAIRSYAGASASRQSGFGVVHVDWAVTSTVANEYNMNVTLPLGIAATVSLPLLPVPATTTTTTREPQVFEVVVGVEGMAVADRVRFRCTVRSTLTADAKSVEVVEVERVDVDPLVESALARYMGAPTGATQVASSATNHHLVFDDLRGMGREIQFQVRMSHAK